MTRAGRSANFHGCFFFLSFLLSSLSFFSFLFALAASPFFLNGRRVPVFLLAFALHVRKNWTIYKIGGLGYTSTNKNITLPMRFYSK